MSIEQIIIVKNVNDLTDSLPAKGKMAVLEHLLATVQEKDLKELSAEGRRQLLSLYSQVSATYTGSSLELKNTSGREIIIKDGSRAIEMHVDVNGETICAVLSDASFGKSRSDLDSYAQELGGRLATREENRAVVNDLLEREEQRTLNAAEAILLITYRETYVRDSQGGLDVDGRRIYDNRNLYNSPDIGALVVLPLAESV